MRALTYALPVAAVLFGVGLLVRSEWDPLIRLDDALIERATAYTRPREGLTDVLVHWQELTQPFKLYLVGTALCLWAWLAKGLRARAAWAFITMMLAWMVGLGAKYLFQRARPVLEDPVSTSPGYSFPSGHAATAVAGALSGARLVPAAAPVLWGLATLMAVSRIYVGVHYPSDVVAGAMLGVVCAYLVLGGRHASAAPWPAPEGRNTRLRRP